MAAAARLAEAGCPSPRADVLALAAHVLGRRPGEVAADELRGAAAGRRTRPTGSTGWSTSGRRASPCSTSPAPPGSATLELAVGPGVFVPRPETELVAQAAIDAAAAAADELGRPPTVVDLCTGSGAIAASVAHEVPGAVVHAVELDPQAHAWAGRNLAGTGVVLHLADATDPAAEPSGLDGDGRRRRRQPALRAGRHGAGGPRGRRPRPRRSPSTAVRTGSPCRCGWRPAPRCCCGRGARS